MQKNWQQIYRLYNFLNYIMGAKYLSLQILYFLMLLFQYLVGNDHDETDMTLAIHSFSKTKIQYITFNS